MRTLGIYCLAVINEMPTCYFLEMISDDLAVVPLYLGTGHGPCVVPFIDVLDRVMRKEPMNSGRVERNRRKRTAIAESTPDHKSMLLQSPWRVDRRRFAAATPRVGGAGSKATS